MEAREPLQVKEEAGAADHAQLAESVQSDAGERGAGRDDACPLTEEEVSEVLSQAGRRMEEVVSHVEECLREAGPRLDGCISEVKLLQLQRDMLIVQLLQLEQPMERATQALRAELSEALKHLARAELERRSLQEQVGQVKRRLFVVVRDCIQSQVTLATQQHEVAQFTITQEELTAQIQELTEEVSQLQEDQQDQLRVAQERARAAGRRRRPRSDLTHCRRLSLDLQEQLRAGAQAVQERYQPRLLTLLRRRQAGEEALRRNREEALDLRARIGPLREQAQALELQRACLEERISLVEQEREENVAQYREILEVLEQSLRDLKTEVQVQKKKNEATENLKNSLSKELDVHRQFVEVYGTGRIPVQERSEAGPCERHHR